MNNKQNVHVLNNQTKNKTKKPNNNNKQNKNEELKLKPQTQQQNFTVYECATTDRED